MSRRRARLLTLQPRTPAIDTRTARPLDKEADPILGSEAHRIWRNSVIERADGKCEWQENGIRCGRNEPRMFADHIVERADGGEPFDPDNGQCVCGKHHSVKTNIEKRKRQERLKSFLLNAAGK